MVIHTVTYLLTSPISLITELFTLPKFHTLHTWKRPWQQLDKDLENTLSTYWVNFAKIGNPNGQNLPVWESYNKQSEVIMLLGDKIEPKPAFMKKEFDFLEMN